MRADRLLRALGILIPYALACVAVASVIAWMFDADFVVVLVVVVILVAGYAIRRRITRNHRRQSG